MDSRDLRELVERATSPVLTSVDWQFVMDVCDYVNNFTGGPAEVAPILCERLNCSERVANMALTVLEACVENCGKPFHEAIGRFKFLNELIRLVSKKHEYHRTPESVKRRILGMFRKWHKELRQPKIDEAYFMLERQGHQFPLLDGEAQGPGGFQKDFLSRNLQRKSSFDEKEKDKMLSKLLQSTDPEDLAAANMLIKEMVTTENIIDQDDEKIKTDLNIVCENVKVFQDFLNAYTPDDGPLKDHEMIQELRQGLLTMRPKLARLCGDLEEDEDVEGVLEVNDQLMRSLMKYDDMAAGKIEVRKPSPELAASPQTSQDTTLIDLFDGGSMNPPPAQSSSATIDNDINALMNLNFGSIQQPQQQQQQQQNQFNSSSTSNNSNPNLFSNVQTQEPQSPSLGGNSYKKEGDVSPVTIYDKNGLNVTIHFQNQDPNNANFLATNVIFRNSSHNNYTNIELQAAVPKSMKVKLQPPSSTVLGALNPIEGPSQFNQIMLFSNPSKAPIRLRFKLIYSCNGKTLEEQGDCNQFPQMV